MISMPDDLLHRLDAHARGRGITRSGLLRELAERELDAGESERRRRVRALLDEMAKTPRPDSPSAAELVRRDRASH